MKPVAAILMISALTTLAVASGRYDLVRLEVVGDKDLQRLEAMGCVVNGPDTRSGGLLVEVPKSLVDELASRGWRSELVMPDIDEFYRQNALDTRFHTYSEIKDSFMLMAASNPTFVRFETLGFASNDSLLFALKITDNPDVEEDEPELLFEAAVHGDEKCATEPIFEWAVYLVSNYGSDPDVTYWVNTREIWVHCVVNPYGHIVGVRSNRNGFDCNRDYGYMWYYETSAREGFTQPETQVHARLSLRNCFSYWQSGHGGTYYVSTPWSYSPFGTRDSMELQYLARQYHDITGYPYGPGYRVMYRINGASKDYAYGAHGAIGWTVETCIYKTPPAESLPAIVAREHEAMRMALANVDRGVRGMVRDSITGAGVRARVRPMPIDFPSYCDSIGDYHRYLRPGVYDLIFEANGYGSETVPGVFVAADTVTRVDIALLPDTTAPITLHRFIAGRGVSDVTMPTTPDWALGERDGRRFSLGRGGYALMDFGQLVFNLGGNDLTVYEDDGDPEGYRVEAAVDWTGPWTVLGTGTGTQGFDLGVGGLSFCRYLRIVDDSSSTSGATAGFDLDAIEAVMHNAAAVVLTERTIVDSPPGGNGDGKLDPGEYADLIVELKNVGRLAAESLVGTLTTADTLVVVRDSIGTFGTIHPDSTRANSTDRFLLGAAVGTPREHTARLKLRLAGGGYEDSLDFDVVVGELRAIDPIPDGPRRPSLYWAYDDTDSGYSQRPVYDWHEIRGLGTRLTLSDDQTVRIDLPSLFGPWNYYGQSFSQISVCSNGWVSPGSTTNSSYSNVSLPDGAQPPNIALFWDDLYPPTGGGVWYLHDTANHRFIVEYDSVHYYSPRTEWDKAQLLLYDTTRATPSGDNPFVVQYYSANNYNSVTVGIEDPSCSVGIQDLHNGDYHRAAAPLAAGRAIGYTTLEPTAIVDPVSGRLTLPSSLGVLPNPSSGPVSLAIRLRQPGPVRVRLYDATGRLVRALLGSEAGALVAGHHRVGWDGCNEDGRRVARGVYLARLDTRSGCSVEKVVRLD